jgi:hypothetical protein
MYRERKETLKKILFDLKDRQFMDTFIADDWLLKREIIDWVSVEIEKKSFDGFKEKLWFLFESQLKKNLETLHFS